MTSHSDTPEPGRAEVEAAMKEARRITAAIAEYPNSLTYVSRDFKHIVTLAAEVTSLRGEAERLTREREWRPIETAPKDGTEFVAAYGYQGFVKQLVNFNTIHNCWQSKGKILLGFATNATHWQPIPQPPALAQGPKP